MAHRYYLHGGAFHVLPDGEALPVGAMEIPRLPRIGEGWHDGRFVTDAEFLADAAVPADHIDRAHAIKAVEAALILSGVHLKAGLLFDEAEATGVALKALAQAAYGHAAAFRKREIERRIAKVSARKK